MTEWIREVQAQKVAAEVRLSKVRTQPRQALDHADLVAKLERLGNLVKLLADADPERKAKIYAGLSLQLVYHPSKKKVLVRQGVDQDHIGNRLVSEGGLEPIAHG